MTINFKDEEHGSVGELSTIRSQFVVKCLYVTRIGRPDILWTVNKLARAVTKRTKFCDKRLSRLTFDFARDFEDSKWTSGGVLCMGRLFPQVGCARNKHLSHTVQEKPSLSLLMQIYVWMEFPLSIFRIWWLKYSIPHQTELKISKDFREYQGNLLPRTSSNMRNPIPTKHVNPDLANTDHVSSNAKQYGSRAMLYVFEVNEAVIKMIIKGRSPTMRHVSRNHRVALDWLLDRINLVSQDSD